MIHLKPINVLLYSASVALVIFALIFAYLILAPVDVLKDWSLHVDTNQTYHAGDTLYVNSSYIKLRKVTGQAKRYLQCYRPGTSTWDGFIPVSQADANRPQSNTKSTAITAIAIPAALSGTPNTCRVYINVDYKINQLKDFTEQNYSNSFKVLPPDPHTVQKNSTQASLPSPNTTTVVTVSSGASHPTTLTQYDNPQPSTENAPVTNNQNVLERSINAVNDGVQSILNTIGGL